MADTEREQFEKCEKCGNPEFDLIHHPGILRGREDAAGMDHEISDSCHNFVARSVSHGAATERYRLTAPVPEGYAFWDINDMKTMQSLVTIFKDFPDAEAEIKRLYTKLIEVNRG